MLWWRETLIYKEHFYRMIKWQECPTRQCLVADDETFQGMCYRSNPFCPFLPACVCLAVCGRFVSVHAVSSQALSQRWAVWSPSLTSWMPSTYRTASRTNLSWLRWSLRFLRAEEAQLEAPSSQSPALVSGAVKEDDTMWGHTQIALWWLWIQRLSYIEQLLLFHWTSLLSLVLMVLNG